MYGRGVRDPLPGTTGAVAGEVGGLDDLSELHELVCGDVTLDQRETTLKVVGYFGSVLGRYLPSVGLLLYSAYHNAKYLNLRVHVHFLTSVGVSLVVVAVWGVRRSWRFSASLRHLSNSSGVLALIFARGLAVLMPPPLLAPTRTGA